MIPFRADLDEYEREAERLFEALKSGDEAVEWRFKWEHPRLRGKGVEDVRAAALDLADARMVIAREHSFAAWDDLAAFTKTGQRDGPVVLFETAVEALILTAFPTRGDFVAYLLTGHLAYHLGQLVAWRAAAGLGPLEHPDSLVA